MQRKTAISGQRQPRVAVASATKAENKSPARMAAVNDGLSAWLARYEPVEREIIKAHERRVANRARRRAKAARAFGDLCETTEGFAVVWRREGWNVREMVRWADGDVLTLLALARWLGTGATKYINRAQSRLRRPLYYERERARREALAAERRRIGGRRTTNPCPTREDILEAWTRRRESHAATVRFGSMIHDLECYVDNSLLRDGTGAIIGRRGGVKAWLQENIPALYVRYTTVMRYKAMAKKLRQVIGLADPVPAEAVLVTPVPAEFPRVEGKAKRDYGAYEILGRGQGRSVAARGRQNMRKGTREEVPDMATARARVPDMAVARTEVPDLAVVRARAVWLEVAAGARGSATALMERLDALTDPERVEDANMLTAWRAKYENEITERMKSRWWRKMARKRDVG